MNPAIRSQSHPQAASPPPFRRDVSLDIAKGFGILLVVLGHCLDGLIAARYFPSTVLWPPLAVYIISLFVMPLFFVVSGHLASGKHRPSGVTMARLIRTLVYPYFLWSIAEGLTLVYFSGYTTRHIPISALYDILWNPINPYWFLYALFLCHAGYLLTRRLSHRIQLLLAIIIFLAPAFFLPAVSHPPLLIVLQTVSGFLFFTLGVISVDPAKQLGRWTAVIATVLFIVLAVAYYQSQLSGAAGEILVIPIALAGIAATLAWSRMLAAQNARPIQPLVGTLAFLGRYSMSIYVMHIFCTAGVRIALKRLAMRPTTAITALEIASALLAGTLLPLGVDWLVSRFELNTWFGLQHMENS